MQRMSVARVTLLLLLSLAGLSQGQENQINFVFKGMIPPRPSCEACPPSSPLLPFDVQDAVQISVVETPYTSATLNDSTRLSFVGSGSHWVEMDGLYGYRLPFRTKPYFNAIYNNRLSSEQTIIHGHGLISPYNLDGVEYISALPVEVNRAAYYNFPLHQTFDVGTFFIHSHMQFQLSRGAAAPLIIDDAGVFPDYPLAADLARAQDVVVFVQDVCPYTADEDEVIINNCNYTEVLAAIIADADPTFGPGAPCPDNGGNDVKFKQLWLNGRYIDSPRIVSVAAGSKVRLRMIGATGMSNVRVHLPVPGTLIATDAHLVKPGTPKQDFWLGVAQRLDVLIDIPAGGGNFPIVVTLEGSVQQAALVLSTPGSPAFDPSTLQPPSDPIGFTDFSDELENQAWKPLPPRPADRVLVVNLTGDNGVKGIDFHSYRLPPLVPFEHNPYPYLVRFGERVEMVINNFTPDTHAMHLHGHAFQVIELNGVKVNGAMRDVLVTPQTCNTMRLAFEANNPGVHLLHCHMQFHFAAGMATTVEYMP